MMLPVVGKINAPLAGAAFLLTSMGLFALWVHDQQGHAFFSRQLFFAGVGVGVMLLAMTAHYRHSRHVVWVVYVLVLAALVALLFVAKRTNGTRGWFAVGAFKIQPAEFAKIAVVLVLARWLSAGHNLQRAGSLFVPALIAMVPMGLILMQPDFGSAMLFVPVLGVMLYVAGARTKHLAVALALMLAMAPVAYAVALKPYQRARLTSFLWPEQARHAAFQQTQSVRACAAGGFSGAEEGGYILPERHTDFVFSIIAEETGFAGCSLLLLLFAAIFLQCGWIATRTRDPYGRLVVVGLLVFQAMQVFVNVGMATGVAPITGLTLPFVSYGGSSLVTCFFSLGLVLNVGARWVPTFSRHDLDAGHVSIRDFVPQRSKPLPL